MHYPPRSIHVFVNPGSGRQQPILAPLNRRLNQTKIEWEVSVLKAGREQEAFDSALAYEPELLVVWGGDGTVAKIATVMLARGCRLPLLPLHGGTANALATHLSIPVDIEQAIDALVTGGYLDLPVDVGVARGHAFLLRLSIGSAAGLTQHAGRAQKEQLGVLSYALSALEAVKEVTAQDYRLTVDGRTTVHRAIACIVANASGTGLKTPLATDLNETDAQLDALLVPDMSWVVRALANAASGAGLMDGAPRLSGVTMSVDCDEPMPVHVDGEPIGSTPVDVEVRRKALRLVRYRGLGDEA